MLEGAEAVLRGAEGEEGSVPTDSVGFACSRWRRRARRRRARSKAGSPEAIESAQTDGGGVPLAPVLARYTEVGLRYKAEKVRDYSAEQDLLGYTLDWNVLRGSLPRYHTLAHTRRPSGATISRTIAQLSVATHVCRG